VNITKLVMTVSGFTVGTSAVFARIHTKAAPCWGRPT